MAQADPGTDAARLEVLKARGEVLDELDRLEASARAAIDVKARVRRSPAKAAAVVGGAGFLALGGPKRVFRGIRRIVRGSASAYPSSMLPEEIERVVRSLGEDGDKVRGTLEREFASYLDATRKTRQPFWRKAVVSSVATPLTKAVLRAGTKRLLEPDPESFARWMDAIGIRRSTLGDAARPSGPGRTGAEGSTDARGASRREDTTD